MNKYVYASVKVLEKSLIEHMNHYGKNGYRIVKVNTINDEYCEIIVEETTEVL